MDKDKIMNYMRRVIMVGWVALTTWTGAEIANYLCDPVRGTGYNEVQSGLIERKPGIHNAWVYGGLVGLVGGVGLIGLCGGNVDDDCDFY